MNMKKTNRGRKLLTVLLAVLLCLLCAACAPGDTDPVVPPDDPATPDDPVNPPEPEEPEEPETDPRVEIVRSQLGKAALVPDVSVNMNNQYYVYRRSDKNQRATFVLPAGEEYVTTAFTPSAASAPEYANLVIPKGALRLMVTVDGFVQAGTAWNGGGAAVARAGAEYAPLYDSGWLNFAAMAEGELYGQNGKVRCLESRENHVRFEVDVSAYKAYDLIWNCTFDMKGKLEDMAALRIDLDVVFDDGKETPPALVKLGSVGASAYSTQGFAVYGDLLFQFYDKMGEIRVFDLSEKKTVFARSFAPIPTYHCNNVSFGRERYSTGDAFPLLYVSVENIAEHKVVAYRVKRTGNDFTFTEVQTVTFPSVTEGGYYYPNATVDAEAGKLWYEGWPGESWHKEDYGAGDALKLVVYDLPKLSDGDVRLGTGTPVDLPIRTATQGFFAENGKLYQAYGLDASNNYLSVIDCATGAELFNRTMAELGGVGAEPEGICRYGEDFVVVTQGGDVWLVDHNALKTK